MGKSFPLPEPYSPEATQLAELLRAKLDEYGTGPGGTGRPVRLGVGPITDMLAMMSGLLDGPRFKAEYLHGHERYVPGEIWIVRDQLTGEEIARYSGYFAGQDARSFAVISNQQHGESRED